MSINKSDPVSLRGIIDKALTYSDEDHLITAGDDTYQFDADGFLTERTTADGTLTDMGSHLDIGHVQQLQTSLNL